MRRKNLNALEGIEREKVRVTGNEVSRVAAHSKFEEHVVFRITAGRYLDVYVDPLGLARQSRKKAPNISLFDISTEPLSAQNFIEFGECREGNQNSSVSERQIKGAAGF